MKMPGVLFNMRQILGAFLILLLIVLAWPHIVYGQMEAKCPDIVGGVDYCPILSQATRCSVYGQSLSCAPESQELQTPHTTTLNCDNCTFSCQSGWADCDEDIKGSGCEKQSQIGQSCTTASGQPGTYTGSPCSPVCTAAPAYVSRQFSDPGTIESGFFYIAGNMKSSAGDLYLASGKAIRVDGSGTTNLNIGNWGDADSTGVDVNIWGNLLIGDSAFKRNIATYGNVGIGTNDPQRSLHIKRDTSASLLIETASVNNQIAAYLSLKHGIGGGTEWSLRNLGGIFQVYDLSSKAERFSIDKQGVVTIPEFIKAGGLCLGNDCKTSWDQAAGGPGGVAGDLLSVLNTGSDASAFTGETKIGGNLFVKGCKGSKYLGKTTATFDGQQGGYATVNNDRCKVQFSNATDAHLCATAEILNSINCGVLTAQAGGGYAWIANGPPGYLAQANDCKGWQSKESTVYGTIWNLDQNRGELTSCNTQRSFACCGY